MYTCKCYIDHEQGKVDKIYVDLVKIVKCPLCKAAPELLEACKVAVLALTHEPIHPGDIEFVKAAIAKAK